MKKLFQGCLVGVAVGDALGLPLEMLKPHEIKRDFGRVEDFIAPTRHKDCNHLSAGQWSDDTLLTIAIAEAIIEAKGIDMDVIAQKHVEAFEKEADGRGFGKATRESLNKIMLGYDRRSCGKVGGAGAGPAMKISPVGLLYYDKPRKIFNACNDITIMTHRDRRAIVGAFVTAMAIHEILVQKIKYGPLQFMDMMIQAAREAEEVLRLESLLPETKHLISKALEKARELVTNKASVPEVICELGNTCYIMDTVPFSLCMFARNPRNFKECLIDTVNAGGDTDTTGAIVGSFLGAMNGIDAIPERWKRVEDYDRLIELADKLYGLTKKQ